MNKLTGFAAATAAVIGVSAFDANAATDMTDTRLDRRDRRLEHPITEQLDCEPELFTFEAVGAFFAGINNVELNRQPVGGGVGAKLNLHLGLASFPLDRQEPDAMANRLYLGLELSDMFVANLTGGVYDGFVEQINAGLSLSVLSPAVGGTVYIGTGIAFVQTLDPWLNEEMAAYANAHVGGRLLFEKFGSLELEVGGVFNGEDSGFYAEVGFGVALPDIY
ncbi:MAG TPA: hypothetical protein HA362_04960 [Nanoarchaeota archaeon]|nr:hypothetical protein [Nanoarchaeota archaeon]